MMQFNAYALFILIVTDIIAVGCLVSMCKSFQTRLLVGIAIACFNFSCCLGVVYNLNNQKYLFSCMACLLSMVIVMSKILDGRYTLVVGGKRRTFFTVEQVENNIDRIKWLGIIFFIIVLIRTVYPTNYLSQLSSSSFTVTGARFALRIARSTGIGWLMQRVELVLLPFFFIWLYTLRKSPAKFLSVFIIQAFCDMLQSQLITSRSHYLQIAFFILIYLYLEKIVSKKVLIVSTVAFGVIAVFLMVWFKNLIQGNATTYDSYGDTLMALLQSEYNGGQWRLDFCNSVNGEMNFIHYIWHILTAPLFFLPDDGFPTLSYFFTSRVLGLTYGQVGYYVILPGAFGEALMVLGNGLAWIYGVFIGIYTGSLFRFLKKNIFLRYVYVYFMIQFAFAFRGSIQSFVLRSFNCIFYFVVVMLLLNIHGSKSVKSSKLGGKR